MDDKDIYQPVLVGTTAQLYPGHIPDRASKEASFFSEKYASNPGVNERRQCRSYSNYFKSAQWYVPILSLSLPPPQLLLIRCRSPDGTTLLTSSADDLLRSYIVPPDLLDPPRPKNLIPYAAHPSPEPVYATAYHSAYNLSLPATCLALASPRSLPIRLFSPFTGSKILASYPLVSPTTEAWIAPHSLLCSPSEPNNFFAGSESCVSVFDLSRDGEGPVSRMHTTPSRRGGGGGGGMKGIVSALDMSSEGILAAGTFSRWVGLYGGGGRGGTVGVFSIRGDNEVEVGSRGCGVTQLSWSDCGRYLHVAERASDGISVWDVRGTRKKLAWLRGREARTQQRLGFEIMARELWAGGVDGVVRIWKGLGEAEGIVEPAWNFKSHGDAISSTGLHSSGSVLATCSGQRLVEDYPNNVQSSDSDSDNGMYSLSSSSSASAVSIGSWKMSPRVVDNSLKLWSI